MSMKIDELLNNCQNTAEWLELMRFGIAGQVAAKNYGWIMNQISGEIDREIARGAKSSYVFLVPHLMEQLGIKIELVSKLETGDITITPETKDKL